MADDNDVDDSWLYGGGQDESSQHDDNEQDETDVSPLKNGNENKTYDTFDEHNFEVKLLISLFNESIYNNRIHYRKPAMTSI